MVEPGLELKSSGIKPHVLSPAIPLLLACASIYTLVGTMNRRSSYLGGLGLHRRVRKPYGGPRQNGTLSFELSCNMAAFLQAAASFVPWQPFQAGAAINV